jgi:uncharacterized protein
MSAITVRTETMIARDGTPLVADIWQPESGGPYPVLLMRQAYGRRIGTSLCYAPPEWYARHGYIVVIQDARGRGESGGAFELFEHEAADGSDTIAWAAGLPNSTGEVGMFGFSFQGSNQLLAAGMAPAALRAIAPAMIGWDLRQDWAYENGAFALRANIGWATQLAAETARLAGDEAAHATLYAASRGSGPGGTRPAYPPHETLLARYSHYVRWRETPDAGPYWDRISPAAHLEAITELKPAVLLIGGWYDSHLPGTLAAFRALSPVLDARLIVGPWAHFPWDRYVGECDFGPEAITDIDQRQIAFFDAALKGRTWDAPRVRLFDMGADCWRNLSDLPTPTTTFSLSGSGRAAIDTRDGRLTETEDHISTERLTLDPWRPAGPCGGSFGLPPGPVDRAKADARSDVLTFTTTPFTQARLLAGTVSAALAVESEHPSFDLHATLSRIDMAGHVWPLAEGFTVAAAGRITVPMRGTCATIGAGERLRVSISLACFPAFPLNPGDGTPAPEASIGQSLVTIVHLRCGAGESELALPWHDELPASGDPL